MSQEAYPHLGHLFGCYMHQDWGFEGKYWPDLVRNFVQCESVVDQAVIAAEIDQLLTDFPDEDSLRNQVYRVLNCYYDPRPDLSGPAVRGWLTQVAAFLRLPGPTEPSAFLGIRSTRTGSPPEWSR